MERTIIRDMLFLRQKAQQATRADLAVGRDLTDTLRANADRCVGMAANMITLSSPQRSLCNIKPCFTLEGLR